ncbi:S41 family peptidase [uncultured Rikenella sp.]|uniref:S41 family peptidase n=1 Tax=uncultured Rikenella sp. TaxID=368003 RepID=UPI0026394E8E|nr:S41 family peptidase [uncultured Rikenella sp.]
MSLGFIPVRAQKYSSAALRADLDTLYRTLQEVHPDLFAVAGRPRLDSMVAALHARIGRADSLYGLEFYSYLLPFFEAIGDGHTSLMPVGIPGDAAPSLPFDVTIPDDSTIRVRRNYRPDSPLPVGTRIDSLDGHSAREVIRRFLVWASGERLPFRLALQEWNFPKCYYWWNTWRRDYRIRGTTPDGTILRETIESIPFRTRWAEQKAAQREWPYSLEILSDTTALLTLRAMVGGKQSQAFFDSVFQELRERRVPNLIVDLRENSGGATSGGDMLLRYLSDRPFIQIEKGVQRGVPDTLRNLKKWWHKPHRARKRYTGQVWMLTSRYTFSSAANLSWAFKYFGMGTVVGEETGGLSVAFGNKRIFELSNSGIQYGVSTRLFYEVGATDDDVHGTLPDYPVPADEALDYTLRLIRQGSSRVK